MGLFDIFKGRKPKDPKQEKPVRNLYVPSILDKWQYKRELYSDDNYEQFLKAFRSLVYTAAMKNATSVASAPLRLYVAKPSETVKSRFPTKQIDSCTKNFLLSKRKQHLRNIPAVRKSVDIDEVVEHPILDLLSRVNPYMTLFELLELTDLHEELTGNSYWYLPINRLGLPQEIWPIVPDKMKIIPDEKNYITGYIYGSSFDNVKFKPEEIIHFKFPSTTSYYYGTSPLAAVRSEYNLLQSIYEYELSSFANSGKPEGYWVAAESLSDEDFTRLKAELKDAWNGINRAGASSLVDNGLEYKAISLSPREMSHLEGKNSLRQDILNAFGQNLALYESTATRANAEAALHFYMSQTITPRLHRIESKLNETLVPMFDESLFLAFSSVVPEDIEAETKRRTEMIRSGIQPINEIRKELRLPPIEGLDEPFLQVQYLPLSRILAGDTLPGNPQNNTNDSSDSDKKDENL